MAIERPSFPPAGVVLKLDFENAFNSVDRRRIGEEVDATFPALSAWFRLCYETPAILTCQGKLLPFRSCRGVQQGDPLGPFFFSLALKKMCTRLRATDGVLSVWYLDDGTIVGPVDAVFEAWQLVQQESEEIGLRLNTKKCELFAQAADISRFPDDIARCNPEGFELLGCPLGSPTFSADYVKHRVDKIESALHNLEIIDDPQVELLLLRNCMGLPKFGFSLRSAPPSHIRPAVVQFDEMIDRVCERRFGLSLSQPQQLQWHLPISLGGVGILRAGDILDSAFLASSLLSVPILETLLQATVHIDELTGVPEALSSLRSAVNYSEEIPSVASALTQRFLMKLSSAQPVLSALVHKTTQAKLLALPLSPREQLRLRAVCRPGAGSWLSVLPVKALGLKMDKPEFSVALRWWLGAPVLPDNPCPALRTDGTACGETLDPFGDHAVMCPCGPSRMARHDAVNWAWLRSLKAVGFHVTPEVHVDPCSKRRSADTLVDNWMHGSQCAHDWVVPHVMQVRTLQRADLDPNTAVMDAETRKNSYAKGLCEARGVQFMALALDTFGGLGAEATQAIQIVANQARLLQGEDCTTTCTSLSQRLRFTVLRGVTRQLLRRTTHPEDAEEAEHLGGESGGE
jgi:ubiquitin carboxyl-terminal hydrolase 44/49